ncbi:MAG: hypothetical protein IIC02_06355, partial [Planctomycetes bacterium]|nr:hypothetical protein [Planctomycetota bacterium]
MQSTRNSNRFPSVFLIVGVAMAAVVPAVRVFSTEKRHAPQRVALIAPGSGSNVAVQFVIEPDNTPEPRTLIAPDASRPDPQVPPVPTAQPGEVDVLHVGRIISATPVARKGGSPSSRAASHLQLGDACDCDEDCDPSLGDQCNIVQCIVRSTCTLDNQTPCITDGDCQGNGTCASGGFRQRCDVVQLVGGSCEAGNGFCIEDRCEDDGTGSEHSICVPQVTGPGAGDLSPCPKQCVGGAANGLRCERSSQCPQGDCLIKGGGQCDEADDVCYVGNPGDPSSAIGRCCNGDSCTETTQAACGGIWLRYNDPEQQEGDGNCICPKYGSGVAPPGSDLGSIGLVRPSGLVCQTGSQQAIAHGNAPVYCEDPDGDGLAPQFCHKRCVGGDNEGAICEVDNPDCALLGMCSISGNVCVNANQGSDCPQGGEVCIPTNPGTCLQDTCTSNTSEGGCEDG